MCETAREQLKAGYKLVKEAKFHDALIVFIRLLQVCCCTVYGGGGNGGFFWEGGSFMCSATIC